MGSNYLRSKKCQMNRIKDVLKEQGRSQKWLSEQVGRSYIIVTNYCNNKSQPSLELLNVVADVLSIDVRELIVPSRKRES